MKLSRLIKKKSPEICIVIGVAGVIAATIKACKATRKLDGILETHEEEIEKIKDVEGICLESEMRKEIATQYAKTGFELVKLYSGPVILGTISIGLIFKGHGILQKRYSALLASYQILDKSYKVYRSRVVEELGEAMDRHFRLGESEEEIEVVDENGKKKKEKVTVVDENLEDYSPYARVFDEFCTEWTDDAGVNKARILHLESYFNDKLKVVKGGKVYLREVYEALGINVTKASLRAGWDRYSNKGDHYVSFGIQDIVKRAREGSKVDQMWVNGIEPSCLLDFNCYDISDDMADI